MPVRFDIRLDAQQTVAIYYNRHVGVRCADNVEIILLQLDFDAVQLIIIF